jgi:hypothetical protein
MPVMLLLKQLVQHQLRIVQQRHVQCHTSCSQVKVYLHLRLLFLNQVEFTHKFLMLQV